MDIVQRAAQIFDRVIVAIVQGRGKDSMFTWEERIELVRQAIASMPTVEVEGYTGLTVEYARRRGAVALVRGIRAASDFEDEFSQALMNRKMAPELDSVYLMTRQDFLYVSASRIREVSRLGYDVADLVPSHVRTAIRAKLGQE
jgi:pantetheine-phosphate adenylyltransferase